jgi:hypothetical protein
MGRELFTRVCFLIGRSHKQGDKKNHPTPYTQLLTVIAPARLQIGRWYAVISKATLNAMRLKIARLSGGR